jgi:ethanolamine utilization protein EutP (predicted NTPase)
MQSLQAVVTYEKMLLDTRSILFRQKRQYEGIEHLR